MQGTCRANGGGRLAKDLFPQAGFPLTYAQQEPGFVCRVKSVPADAGCQRAAPANAFWGLWWSDGDPGSGWTFANVGVGGLRIPDGGLVAFAWDQRSGSKPPDASPNRPAPAQPEPEPEPSAPPPSDGGSGGSGGLRRLRWVRRRLGRPRNGRKRRATGGRTVVRGAVGTRHHTGRAERRAEPVVAPEPLTARDA